jgi:hypothetical protein
MENLGGLACLGGFVGLGFLGIFVLWFSPRVIVPRWLFALLSLCLPASLGVFLGVALDVAFLNHAPLFALIGAGTGVAAGGYFALDVYRVGPSRFNDR